LPTPAIQAHVSDLDLFIEAVAACRDAETSKDVLTFHRVFSFEVLDGLVDRSKQRARPCEIFLQSGPVRS